MFVRLKYYEYGIEKGYLGWIRSKRELIGRLLDLKIPIHEIHYLAIQKKGDKDFKEYDPVFLKNGSTLGNS